MFYIDKRASEQSISFFLSMPKWTHALFATNQCDQDKRGFNVADTSIGSIGPAIAVLTLTGTHTGGQSSSNLNWTGFVLTLASCFGINNTKAK